MINPDRSEASGSVATVGTLANDANGYKWDGWIDELHVWSAKLDATQMSALYTGGRALDPTTLGFASSLSHWWRFGDGAQDTFPAISDQVGSESLTLGNGMTASHIQLVD